MSNHELTSQPPWVASMWCSVDPSLWGDPSQPQRKPGSSGRPNDEMGLDQDIRRPPGTRERDTPVHDFFAERVSDHQYGPCPPDQAVRQYGWDATCTGAKTPATPPCSSNRTCASYAGRPAIQPLHRPGGSDFCMEKVSRIPTGDDSGGPVINLAHGPRNPSTTSLTAPTGRRSPKLGKPPSNSSETRQSTLLRQRAAQQTQHRRTASTSSSTPEAVATQYGKGGYAFLGIDPTAPALTIWLRP